MKTKSLIALILCIGTVLSAAIRPDRDVRIGKNDALTLKPGNHEIVISPSATPIAKWTANDLAATLKEVFGTAPEVVTAPTGKIPIFLGIEMSNLDKAAVAKLKDVRDSYYITVTKKGIFLAGNDDEKTDPAKAIPVQGVWGNLYERGTMMASFDFAERFLGVRFYFSGKLGTIYPKTKECKLKECTIFERPDFITRRYSAFWDGRYFEGEKRDATINPAKTLQMYHNRTETEDIPFCHGSNFFNYLWRFKDTHPEYFAMLSNGKRYNDPNMQHPGQLCYSSGICEEVYQDVKAIFTKQPADTRGMVDKNGKPQKHWGVNCRGNKYVDIMPQDSYTECHCDKCQAAYQKEKGHSGYATELIWKYVTDIGFRLKKENIPGEITMMAYWPYRDLPQKVKIPDNVNIMFATAASPARGGKMADAERAEIMKWINATNKKVWFWTYVNKSGVLTHLTRNVPNPTPREVGHFYQDNAHMIFGGFMENEADRYLYQAMNNYMFSKVTWNNKLDVDKEMDDFYALMFGPASEDMKNILEGFSKIWINEIAGRVTYTQLGPVNSPPSSYDLWTKIYNKEKIAALTKQFDAAAAKVSASSLEGQRIALYRREYLEPLAQAQAEYVSQLSAISHFRFSITDHQLSEPVYLRPFQYKANAELVSTAVSFAYENDALHFRYVCEEPYMDKILAAQRKHDDPNMWKDNSLELFINPSGDRKEVYQFIINSEGCISDMKRMAVGSTSQADPKWDSNTKVTITKEAKQWIADVFVPLADLPNLNRELATFNFCRSRYLEGAIKAQTLYMWSPFATGFHDYENFGTLVYNMKQLVKNSQFSIGGLKNSPRHYGVNVGKGKDYRFDGWIANGSPEETGIGQDKEVYLTAPASIRMNNPIPKPGEKFESNLLIRQWIPELKPSTRYRMTYMVKMKDVAPVKSGGGFLLNYYDTSNKWYPTPALTGTFDNWTAQSFEFTTSPDTGKTKGGKYFGLHMLNATGTVWVDHVILEELK